MRRKEKKEKEISDEEFLSFFRMDVTPEDYNTPLKALKVISKRIDTFLKFKEQIFSGTVPDDSIPPELLAFAGFMEVTPPEALILYAGISLSLKSGRQDFEDYCRKLELDSIASMDLIQYFDKLAERNYLFFDKKCYSRGISIAINFQLIDAINENNLALLPQKRQFSDWKSLAVGLRKTLRRCDLSNEMGDEIWHQFRTWRLNSDSFGFWPSLDRFYSPGRILLLICLDGYFFEDNRAQISIVEYGFLFDEGGFFNTSGAMDYLRSNPVFEEGLVEFVLDELIEENRDTLVVALTQKGMDLFFEGKHVAPLESAKPQKTNLLKPSGIKPVQLYFSGENEREIRTLENLLDKDTLEQFFSKMQKRNLPACLSILLSGPPGTGKTELALQVAKKSGREILKVDLSSLKDKFVGESEKNVRAIFKNYEDSARHCELTPILLLNEADGLLTKRREVNSAVDQMLNTMQTILLEQMESLKGIIIATTNLRSHFDPAFDRRFTFKIDFKNPCEKSRMQILRSLLPDLQEEWLQTLASAHELSGGQWRNVAFRAFMEEALGNEISLEQLKRLATAEENGGQTKKILPIGF